MAATNILNKLYKMKNLGGEILYLSLGPSTDSITSSSSNTHTTISRGPAVGNNKERILNFKKYLGGGLAAAGAGL